MILKIFESLKDSKILESLKDSKIWKSQSKSLNLWIGLFFAGNSLFEKDDNPLDISEQLLDNKLKKP